MKFFAYLDPGTGSIIIQAVIGAIAGAAFFFRNTFRRVWTKLTSKSSDSKSTKDDKKTK